MKLPRDLSGVELTRRLRRYGYGVTRQTGSHMRLTSLKMGRAHHLTVPAHDPLRPGTLSGILTEVSEYLHMPREVLMEALFGE